MTGLGGTAGIIPGADTARVPWPTESLSLEESELTARNCGAFCLVTAKPPEDIPFGVTRTRSNLRPSNTHFPVRQAVHLAVYDLLGRRVAVLTDEVHQAGAHTVRFDPSGLSSGMYVYRLVADKQVLTGHMLFVR